MRCICRYFFTAGETFPLPKIVGCAIAIAGCLGFAVFDSKKLWIFTNRLLISDGAVLQDNICVEFVFAKLIHVQLLFSKLSSLAKAFSSAVIMHKNWKRVSLSTSHCKNSHGQQQITLKQQTQNTRCVNTSLALTDVKTRDAKRFEA